MRADRLLGITLMLMDRGRISAHALADAFEVSVRTIYRDIECLARAGVPVFATPGAGGGIQLMPGYRIDGAPLTPGDVNGLLSALGALEGLVSKAQLVQTEAKLRALLPRAMGLGERDGCPPDGYPPHECLPADRVRICSSPWIRNDALMANLEPVRRALEERRLLGFVYIDGHGATTRRTAEPLQLIIKDGRPYVYAWCRLREGFRLFKLARMAGLEVADERFEPRPAPDPLLDATPHVHELMLTITLRVDRTAAERVADICPFDAFAPDGPDHWLVAFPFIDRAYYYDMLLGFGEGCEVVAPPHIRAKMAEKVARFANLYGAPS